MSNHKELFAELTKLALEKKAYGPSYLAGAGYSPYRGRRGGGGGFPGMFMSGRGGTYAGIDPRMLPMMQAQFGQDLPHMGIGGERQYQREQQEANRIPGYYGQFLGEHKKGPEWDTKNEGREDLTRAQQQLAEAHAQRLKLDSAHDEAAANARTKQDLMNMNRTAVNKWRAGQPGMEGILGRVQTGLADANPEADALVKGFTEADAAHQTAKQNRLTHMDAYDKAVQDATARRDALQAQIDTARQTMTEHANIGRNKMEQRDTFNQGKNQEMTQQGQELFRGGNRGAISPPQRGPAVPAPRPTPTPQVPSFQGTRGQMGQLPQKPMGGALHPSQSSPGTPPVTPPQPTQQMPPIGQTAALPPVGPPKMAGSILPPLTLDQLSEGAARSMFERYVKLANANLELHTKHAAALETAKYMAGTDKPVVKPPTSKAMSIAKPVSLRSAAYLNKKPGEFARAANNNLLGRGTK